MSDPVENQITAWLGQSLRRLAVGDTSVWTASPTPQRLNAVKINVDVEEDRW